MDYKTLHGGGSLAASSRSMPGRNLAESARNLRAVLPDEASEALARVEDLLVEIAGCAPEELVEPALEALTAGGERRAPVLPGLGGGVGARAPRRAGARGAHGGRQASAADTAGPERRDGRAGAVGFANGRHGRRGPAHGDAPRGRRGGAGRGAAGPAG